MVPLLRGILEGANSSTEPEEPEPTQTAEPVQETQAASRYTYQQVASIVKSHFRCIVESGYNKWAPPWPSVSATFENGMWTARADYKRSVGGGYGSAWATFAEETGTIVTISSPCIL